MEHFSKPGVPNVGEWACDSIILIGAKLAYSPDGTRLAVAYSDPIAKVWDVTTGKLLLSLAGHTDAINSLHIASMERGLRLLPGMGPRKYGMRILARNY